MEVLAKARIEIIFSKKMVAEGINYFYFLNFILFLIVAKYT